jgi:hypothetical protein
MDELLKQARATHEVEKAYSDAFRKNKWTLKPLDAEMFWVIVDSLRDNLVSGLAAGRRVESEVHNLMCTYVHGSYSRSKIDGWPEEKLPRWENMVRFLVKYEEMKATLSKKMYDMKGLERGDDGYGDLMDSMPLAGREVVDGIMNDDIANYKQLEKALADHPLKDFILCGENYVEMALEEKLKEQLPGILACMDYDENADPPEAIEPHVVVVLERDKPQTPWGNTESMTLRVRGPFKNGHEAIKFTEQQGGQAIRLLEGVVKR